MKVPFVSLNPMHEELMEAFEICFHDILQKSEYILGKKYQDFCSQFAAYCGAGYAVGCGSGLDSLHFILKAFGIGELLLQFIFMVDVQIWTLSIILPATMALK